MYQNAHGIVWSKAESTLLESNYAGTSVLQHFNERTIAEPQFFQAMHLIRLAHELSNAGTGAGCHVN